MGLSDDIKKVEANLKRIAGYYDELNKKNPFSGANAKNIASSTDEMQKLEAAVKGAASLVEEMDKSLSSLVKAFESANNEIKSSSAGLTSMNQILSQSSKAAGRVLNHQEGISILSVKQLKKEEEKIKAAQSRLKITRSLLEEEQNALLLKQESGELGIHEQSRLNKIKSALQINNRLIEDKDGLYANTVKHLEDEIKAEKRLQSRLGVVGGLLKGISKIPILGDIFDANEAVEEMDAHLRNGGTAVGALFKGFKSVATQIKDGILNPANMIVGLFTLAVDLFKSIDTQTGEFAANMGVTHAEAMGTKEEMMSLAQSTGDSSVRSDILLKSQMAIGKEIGSNAKLNQKDLVTMNKLVNAGKLRMESAAKLEKLSLRTGKSLNKTTKEILGASKAQQMKNGLVLNEMDILDDVANIGDRLALSLGDNPAALAEAAVQARKFGINLQQAEKMARGLLNFEDSIQKEMEAELLTGKSLNLEKARGLALQGKSSEAAAEMLKQVGSSKKFGDMLVPQQEALAASMNMSADEMAKSLRDKEALIKLGGKEGQSAQQRYNEMVAANMSEAEIRKQLGNDEMADMMAKQNIQDKFNDTMFKLKEVLANQLMPVFKQISGFLEKNKDSILSTIKTVGRLVATFMVLKGVISAINILKEAGNTISSGGAIIQNGILATLGLQDSVLAYQMAKAEGMNTLQAFREGMEQNILGKMILQGGRIIYNIGKNAIALGQKAIEVAANGAILSSLTAMGVGIVKNIAKGAIFLVQLLGQAAAALATNAAITFGVGTIVAVGAAYAAYAGIKALTGNDVMSPGKNKPGYGERTLMGPEGAIQLNDKDTVIAGTSLFGNDSVSEPGKSTEMAGKGELKVKSEGLDMSAVIEAINSLAGRPISIQIDGREIAIATEDGNPRAMGENRGANSFQIN